MTAPPTLGSHRYAGLVTRGELLASGLTVAEIRRLLRDGTLLSFGGVYAPAEAVAREELDQRTAQALPLAAVLAVAAPGTAGSHQCAARIHGLELLGRQQDTVSVTRRPGGPGSRSARRGVRVHTAGLPPSHVMTWKGLLVTTPARTVVDLARNGTFRQGVVVADSALRQRRTTAAELGSVLADCAHWHGIQRAREVVAFADGRSESVLESLARVVIREQGLPPPELQVWVGDDEQMIGRADFLWSRYRTIGEADGTFKYDGKNRAISQLRRDAQLREAGFEVVHFTWEEIIYSPAKVAASLRAAFRRGSAPRH